MAALPEKKTALIVVRTYPTPAKRSIEVSCTAAITDQGQWLRLFPIPYRLLDEDKRFRKYQWIEVTVTKARDQRPESYRIHDDSIKMLSEPLSVAHEWRARKDIVLPLKAHCMCCLQRERDERGHPTLGIFRPKTIRRLLIEPDNSPWTPTQLAALRQGHLFQKGPAVELEKIPYDFKYEFRCDEDSCKGHSMICTDWEMGESWRKWSREYGDQWEGKFRQRYEAEMIGKYDTHFYVGTIHRFPNVWIIVGLFYPPKPASLPLFP